MFALVQCKRVNNPTATRVNVESVQFVENFNLDEFTTPAIGEVGTAVLELDPTIAAESVIIDKLANDPTKFAVIMTRGWQNGYAIADPNRLTIPEESDAFERKLDTIDTSKGGPSLLRSKEITFFKNV